MSPEDEAILEALHSYCLYGYDRLAPVAVINGGTIPGYVVVADLDHDLEIELDIYTWDHVRAWYGRALAYIAENHDPEEDDIEIDEALNETWEEPS